MAGRMSAQEQRKLAAKAQADEAREEEQRREKERRRKLEEPLHDEAVFQQDGAILRDVRRLLRPFGLE